MTVAQFWKRSRMCQMVDLWSSNLGIEETVMTHPISRWQVTGPDDRPGASLVGVVERMGIATIYHTRSLREDDVVHELLHVRFPQLCHEEVEAWTDALVAARKAGKLEQMVARLNWEMEMPYAAADAAG